jgi:hypothetical protein
MNTSSIIKLILLPNYQRNTNDPTQTQQIKPRTHLARHIDIRRNTPRLQGGWNRQGRVSERSIRVRIHLPLTQSKRVKIFGKINFAGKLRSRVESGREIGKPSERASDWRSKQEKQARRSNQRDNEQKALSLHLSQWRDRSLFGAKIAPTLHSRVVCVRKVK